MKMSARVMAVALLALGLSVMPAVSADLTEALDSLLAVGPEGDGNEAAAIAWQQAAAASASQVPTLLAALDDANPLSANWIRTAVDTVCERSLADGGKLPRQALEQFTLDTSHAPKARRLAYEWLLEVDSAAEDRIVPKLLDDPSVELRRDAVAQLIRRADAEGIVEVLQEAFAAARDRDQIGDLVDRLKKRDQEADLVKHDGLIVHWQVIGPFDNTEKAGFDKVFPPEKGFDPDAEYQGKRDKIRWREYSSDDPQGMSDLYKALADLLVKQDKINERDVVAYAVAEFHSPSEQKVQIRSASYNAIKIWVNGRLVDEHKVYHSGSVFDQYRAEATLKPGKNLIMVKLCQNAQTQSWTNVFAYQLRVCDAIGGGIPSEK